MPVPQRQDKMLILIVEDSPEDYAIASRAIQRTHPSIAVHRCEDADEMLEFLYHRGRYEDSTLPLPGIILLDLNLPAGDGREALETLKTSEKTRNIPVVILTTSSDERDIETCYAKGANSYIQKPVNMQGYLQTMERLKEYWFRIVTLPTRELA